MPLKRYLVCYFHSDDTYGVVNSKSVETVFPIDDVMESKTKVRVKYGSYWYWGDVLAESSKNLNCVSWHGCVMAGLCRGRDVEILIIHGKYRNKRYRHQEGCALSAQDVRGRTPDRRRRRRRRRRRQTPAKLLVAGSGTDITARY